jgi:hypothetical protein
VRIAAQSGHGLPFSGWPDRAALAIPEPGTVRAQRCGGANDGRSKTSTLRVIFPSATVKHSAVGASLNAGSNTFADHAAVLTAALRQIPARMRSKLLVRVDGAGASHELITHLLSLAGRRRAVLFTCGWAITGANR